MVIASLLLTVCLTLGQPPPRVDEAGKVSAAGVYEQVGREAPDGLKEALGWVKLSGPGLNVSPGGPDVEAVRKALVAGQPLVARIIETTKLGEFGGDFKSPEDPFATIPEDRMAIGGRVRLSYRLLRADAARCWEDGDRRGCATRIAAIVRLSRQCAGQSVILSLVSSGGLDMAFEAVDVYTREAAPWESKDRAIVLAEIERLRADDPALIRESWRSTARRQAAWLRTRLQGDGGGRWLDAQLQESGTAEEEIRGRETRLREIGLSAADAQRMWEGLPRKLPDNPAKAMATKELLARLSQAAQAAESLGEATGEGAASGPAVERARELMNSDRTQLARILMGVGPSVMKSAEESVKKAKAARAKCAGAA